MKNIKIEIDNNDKIFLNIPIEYLIFSQFNRKDIPLKITDRDKMIKWAKKYLLEYKKDDEDEMTAFETFIYNMFVYAYEQGETWLEGFFPDLE